MVREEKGNSCGFLSFSKTKRRRWVLCFSVLKEKVGEVVFVRWLSGEKKKNDSREREVSSFFLVFLSFVLVWNWF